MPAFSTHYIFAKELEPQLKEMCDTDINSGALMIGAQGPDIFFFARIFPWLIGKPMTALGSQLHRTTPSVILEAMRNYCDATQNKALALSYAYGFIMHYALDCTCHPYVYSMQNSITQKNRFANPHTVHNCIEFAMDSILLNKRLGIKKPHAYSLENVISDSEEISDEIARMYAKIIPQIYPTQSVTEKQIKNAVKDTRYAQRITLDKTGIKRALVAPIELLASPFTHNYKITSFMRPRDLEKSKKYANIEHRQWVYPTADIKSTKSFDELFEQAKAYALEIIYAFNSHASLKQATKDKSFLTGVEPQ